MFLYSVVELLCICLRAFSVWVSLNVVQTVRDKAGKRNKIGFISPVCGP